MSHRPEHSAATTSTRGRAPTQAAITRTSAPPLPLQPANERACRCRRRQLTHSCAAAFSPICAAVPEDEEDDSDKDDRKEEAVELGDAAHRLRVEVREANEHPRRVRPPREALRQHAVWDGVRVRRAAYVERSFLVESPPGSPPSTGDRHGLMQVELLRPVAAAEEEGFKVRVLDKCGETWEEADDIGDVVVVVDASGAGAASTRECPRLRLSTMYFAVDPTGETRVCTYSLAAAGSYVSPTSPAVSGGRDGLVRHGLGHELDAYGGGDGGRWQDEPKEAGVNFSAAIARWWVNGRSDGDRVATGLHGGSQGGAVHGMAEAEVEPVPGAVVSSTSVAAAPVTATTTGPGDLLLVVVVVVGVGGGGRLRCAAARGAGSASAAMGTHPSPPSLPRWWREMRKKVWRMEKEDESDRKVSFLFYKD
uniref:Uncharacterized protein n=1 Tax=Oryza sativa subsp. japonica TaxID=39947 RepID=Q6I5W6_ORYSJ|nr:hypothetical protein [Oryza sativa Japonica Group]